ncbi:hypothetical protein GYMLUDRAFT_59154 [Collybiopsis luxurians FD-317 M1]|uniref:F-box domain-containing protein n=1 Tax=Collybiopsis luxurians FD-317 M1 TaxID=944289 RepID=A0A0D0BZC0_9AGAR|nr:hypothetical protein GYMLUDRAFT_59154 [Collybiopsis luxurians FD-317 M1]
MSASLGLITSHGPGRSSLVLLNSGVIVAPPAKIIENQQKFLNIIALESTANQFVPVHDKFWIALESAVYHVHELLQKAAANHKIWAMIKLSRDFPTELLQEIGALSHSCELCALTRTNKRFYRVFNPSLYSSIPCSALITVACPQSERCPTLKPHPASFVRNLDISDRWLGPEVVSGFLKDTLRNIARFRPAYRVVSANFDTRRSSIPRAMTVLGPSFVTVTSLILGQSFPSTGALESLAGSHSIFGPLLKTVVISFGYALPPTEVSFQWIIEDGYQDLASLLLRIVIHNSNIKHLELRLPTSYHPEEADVLQALLDSEQLQIPLLEHLAFFSNFCRHIFDLQAFITRHSEKLQRVDLFMDALRSMNLSFIESLHSLRYFNGTADQVTFVCYAHPQTLNSVTVHSFSPFTLPRATSSLHEALAQTSFLQSLRISDSCPWAGYDYDSVAEVVEACPHLTNFDCLVEESLTSSSENGTSGSPALRISNDSHFLCIQYRRRETSTYGRCS